MAISTTSDELFIAFSSNFEWPSELRSVENQIQILNSRINTTKTKRQTVLKIVPRLGSANFGIR